LTQTQMTTLMRRMMILYIVSWSYVELDGYLTTHLIHITSPLSLRRDSFITPGFEDFFSAVTLKFDFLPWKWFLPTISCLVGLYNFPTLLYYSLVIACI
jgi:hypothetical protein